MSESEIVIAVTYPRWMEVRPEAETLHDLALVAEMDPRVRVVRDEYEDSEEMRTLRGTPPFDGLQEQQAPISERMRDLLGEAEVILGLDLPFELLTLAPELRWVQCMGAGVGPLISCGLPNERVRLTTGSGNNSVSISEFVIARLLGIWKRFRDLDAKQQARDWTGTYGREASRRTLGLVGLGAINANVAKRAKAFDMQVLATRRSYTPGADTPHVDELYPRDRLHDMLARCDAVCSAVPETPETVRMFDEVAFSAMKPGSVFINVGRGTAVDEEALDATLRSGHLSAAAIDVAEVEPLTASSLLWETPNLYISPHSASSPDYFFATLYETFRENLRRYLTGDAAMINEVSSDGGY
jgi:phosphoglycerate dehydrogenase-like enzyme